MAAPSSPPDRERSVSPESASIPQIARGLAMFLGGMLLTTAIMAYRGHTLVSVPVGLLGVVVAAIGLLSALGSFAAPEPTTSLIEVRGVVPRMLEWLGTLLALSLCVRLAVAGILPMPLVTNALLVVTSFVAVVVSSYRFGRSLGVWDEPRSLLQRHGFWLMLLYAVLYLPLLGSFTLIDPWETHYGEVAREMLARDDWLSLWWAQDGWFWSKPILDFWLQGLSFSLHGVAYKPDQVLAAVGQGQLPAPEWAARLPIFLLTAVCSYIFYKCLALVVSRRMGFWAALVTATTPYWYLLARQTMTDMPYVAPLTAGMGLFLLALHQPPEAKLVSRKLVVLGKSFHLSGQHLALGVLLVGVLPQIAYLVAQNLSLSGSRLEFVLDSFLHGSGGGNCGLHGNAACRVDTPRNPFVQPALSGGIWTFAVVALLLITRQESRRGPVLLWGAWLMVALSSMAKGAPGLVLPLFTFAVFLVATRRWAAFGKLELGPFLLIFACLVLPWYVQMVLRHGPGFTDRLLFHDMYKRAFLHVHDTNLGDDVSISYYIWQLGYGLFPWTGLCAAGLLWWVGPATSGALGRQGITRPDVSVYLALWAIVAFGLFSVSETKFHHYILPMVPALSALAGGVLDEMAGHTRALEKKHWPSIVAQAVAVALLLLALVRLFNGSPWGTPLEPDATPTWQAVMLLLAAGLVAAGAWWLRRSESGTSELDSEPPEPPEQRTRFGLLATVGATGAALAGSDLLRQGDDPGAVRLMHLFTYQYERSWPENLNMSACFAAITIATCLLCLALTRASWRRQSLWMLGLCATLAMGWGVNVYLYRASPHWGQRSNIETYYRLRSSDQEPLVAFQMNWKGENFYTGNRLPAFVKTGTPFKDWLTEQRKQGLSVVFFTTEHSRVKSLKRELGPVESFKIVTTKEDNSRFMVARVKL